LYVSFPPAAPSFPALPWFIALLCLVAMPLCFSITMIRRYGHQTCDRDVLAYLEGQMYTSVIYVVGVGVPMWRRINWVGALKDAIAESPENLPYVVATTLWWFQLGWTFFGVKCAVEAGACSDGLKYASETLAWYMLCLGNWLDLAFHIVIPALLHLYSGQPGADILPPGVDHVDPPNALPPAPPKRKAPPPKRECPKCRLDKIADEYKMCPVCNAFVPPLEYFIKKAQEEKDKDFEEREKEREKAQGMR